MTRAEKEEFITNTAMDLTQVPLSKKCGKYFNLMYLNDLIVVESFEDNDGYAFTNIRELSDAELDAIYEDLAEDFA